MVVAGTLLRVLRPWKTAINQAKQILTAGGLEVVQSFDLQSAQAGCACQMLILLVYGAGGRYVTLILEGDEHRTRISLEASTEANRDLEYQVYRLLAQKMQGIEA